MDKYLKSILKKRLHNTGFLPSPVSNSEKMYLDLLLKANSPRNLDLLAHIFSNCRAFHETPCEVCEYRFRCYTE